MRLRVQPIPEKMTLEIVIRTEIRIVKANVIGFFPNEIFQKNPVMIIPDSRLHPDNHFVSHLHGHGLQPPLSLPPHTSRHTLSPAN